MPLTSKDRIDYNVNAILSGDFKPEMLSWFIAQGQTELGVPVDGRAGPFTMAAAWERIHSPLPTSLMPLGRRALACAISDIGKGEEGGNNVGPYVTALRSEAGLGWTTGPWCGVACSAWFMRAWGPQSPLPFHASASALTLFENACMSNGAMVVVVPDPGALICWVRRNKFGFKNGHHIALVDKYDPKLDGLQTVDGNHNLKGRKYALVDRFPHPQGSWRKDLVGMVLLP